MEPCFRLIVACGMAFDEKFPFALKSPKKFHRVLMNQFQSQAEAGVWLLPKSRAVFLPPLESMERTWPFSHRAVLFTSKKPQRPACQRTLGIPACRQNEQQREMKLLTHNDFTPLNRKQGVI